MLLVLFLQLTTLIDQSFDPLIRTIQLNPQHTPTPLAAVSPAVSLENQQLMLEFDDLREQTESYYVKLIHCHHDWQPSELRDLEFLQAYNEFNINEYAYSSNTHLPYVHYRFEVPAVKIPGNYVLLVYRDGDESEKVLTRRFMVFDNIAGIAPAIRPGQMALDRDRQQINFTVDHRRLDVPDPLRSVQVVVRQNNRWDNAITGLTPSRIDDYRKQLEYVFTDRRKSFPAGNEFRFFDISSVNFPGQNTARLDRSVKPFHLYVATEKPRGSSVYAQYRDLNGSYILENRDAGAPDTNGQYVYVHFTLDYQPAENEEIFVGGAWSNWSRQEAYRMRKNGNLLESVVLLKQGFYYYRFTAIRNSMEIPVVEGDFAETENDYEILVYFRDPRLMTDLLVGYSAFKINPR